MKLIEALKISGAPESEGANRFAVSLVCGFNPLHLKTFLSAELRRRSAGHKFVICTGLYGDFWGNLERARETQCETTAVFVEWPDLDPRLGIRRLGGWSPSVLPKIAESVRERIEVLLKAVALLSATSPVVISLPTLPLPPIAFTTSWCSSELELNLRATVAVAAKELAHSPNVSVVNQQYVDRFSPFSQRADAQAEMVAGFPYQLTHASVLANQFSRLLWEQAPKKGLVTDLDNTLWRGILGDDGVQGVWWDLDHNSQGHGLYQQLLHALAEAGVLIACASKNDPRIVEQAFRRKDMILPRTCIFPMEAHWNAKSESVTRILKTWNISADDVIFVDDNRAEIAEVQSVHSTLEGVLFPATQPQEICNFLGHLRDFFGKKSVIQEDAIRLRSLRQAHELREAETQADLPELFLRQAEAELTVSFAKEPLDPRALELLNKTNQFNLNGRRYNLAEWQRFVLNPETLLMMVAYRDKYGPLGKIAVITGQRENGALRVSNWVMSCRAFGRRIEFKCLEILCNRFDASQIQFDFLGTGRNGPMRSFLEEVTGTQVLSVCRVGCDLIKQKRPKSFYGSAEVSRD